MSAAVPDQQFQMSNIAFVPAQQTHMPMSDAQAGMPVHFANGVPIINAEGNIQLAFPPPQIQFMQQQSAHSPAQQQHMPTPPQIPYAFATPAGGSPSMQATVQEPKQTGSDFFVHEYTPPDAIKRAATPRRMVDTGPKNYTFSNSGPENFDEKKAKKAEAKESGASSSSPASSIGTASTS